MAIVSTFLSVYDSATGEVAYSSEVAAADELFCGDADESSFEPACESDTELFVGAGSASVGADCVPVGDCVSVEDCVPVEDCMSGVAGCVSAGESDAAPAGSSSEGVPNSIVAPDVISLPDTAQVPH